MTGLLYFLFFCSGFSGLIYQVVWVRVFGNVFGNTIYSASLVVAVFMLGLGVGSYIVGAWADRRYAELSLDRDGAGGSRRRLRSEPLLRAYGVFEIVIAALGLGISVLLPRLGQVSAVTSSYSIDANGWYVLSTISYVARAGIAVALLAPITLVMGGTLTLLIRHLVRKDFDIGGWRIAALYGANTIGAALGCLLTDFTLVPAFGLRTTQMIAVAFNVAAAAGAFSLAAWAARRSRRSATAPRDWTASLRPPSAFSASTLTGFALALSGFAAMGMEILWFRHFSILLGEFRAVFSLLLSIVLLGIGMGSFAGGFVHRRTAHPGQWLIVVQGLFVALTLLGLAAADADSIRSAGLAHAALQAAAGRELSGWARGFEELWFNAKPILLEVAVPALLMGFAFPLGNALIQRAERSVGRRAGALYLANTAGAVCGALAAGFLLLPVLGIQGSATVLTVAAALAIVPLHLAARTTPEPLPFGATTARGLAARGARAAPRHSRDLVSTAKRTNPLAFWGRRWQGATSPSLLLASAALGLWLLLPSDYVIARALVAPAERLLTLSEGVTEVIAVADVPNRGRLLLTNGHPMSSTGLLSQRYMRALAHIPLLSIESPDTVLVMCFGIGNTAHAATLHPSIQRVEVVDTSRHVLAHAGYFRDVNEDVLGDRRVAVYVNDGRHHLQMQREGSYDVITLEPPPIAHAGVGALYSKEFYALARTRLKPKGYISQWLPVSQVPEETSLAMIRAFIDVFPQSVLLSGSYTDLLLVGANDSRIEIDPGRLAAALANAPAVQADLERLGLGSVREIVGSFVGSAQTLADATRGVAPVSDDRPMQEYSVRSLLKFGEAPLDAFIDLTQIAAWCPKCLVEGKLAPLVDGLETYLALLGLAYGASPGAARPPAAPPDGRPRVIADSAYLGAVVPESADLHNVLGAALAANGNAEEAIAEFREALRLDPDSATAHWNLGRTLVMPDEALPHLRRSVELDPRNGQVRYQLATLLLESRRYDEALEEFGAALRLMPDSVEVRNNLGVVLASQDRLDEAIDQFRQALTLQPGFADARRNLTMALEKQRRTANAAREPR